MSSFFQYYALIEHSGLFDPSFYRGTNPDVAAANVDPQTHYLESGGRGGLNPSKDFDAAYYMGECRRLGIVTANPLVHYILHGSALGLKPIADADGSQANRLNGGSNHLHAMSLDQSREYVSQALRSPFVDDALVEERLGASKDSSTAADLYLRLPVQARPNLSRLFDREFYLQSYPDVALTGTDALLHFIGRGCAEGRSPHPFVDIQYITSLDETLLSSQSMLKDLWDVLRYNLADPSPYFSIDYYHDQLGSQLGGALELNRGFLEHFLGGGYRSGLRPNPLFDPTWYCRQLDDVVDIPSAIRHFVLVGDKEGRAPSPEFSSKRYLLRHPDVADARIPPLAHYLLCGRREGRTYTAESAPVQSPTQMLIGGLTAPEIRIEDAIGNYGSMKDRVEAIRQQNKDRTSTAAPHMVRYEDALEAHAEIVFRKRRSPQVSIIVPVYNEVALTLECLGSIFRSGSAVSYEVIIADDASSDPAIENLRKLGNLIFVRQPANVGFLENCNAAYHHCRGKYVLLLNNDAQLMPGALDALVAVLDAEPDVAAVGPKILYPDGRLQEAGCSIDRAGVSTMVGLFCDPNLPEFCVGRDVHYCSGASLLVRRSEIGEKLFDGTFAPAYCEDADLCLRFLSRGRRIRYCADATVIHHLSVSTNKQSVAKRLQLVARNQQKLTAKWSALLEELNRARVICFYLPQFHTTPENDFNWGQGFTEWTNVTRAKPRYANHYQPHLPADLGFYDLRLKQTIERQVALARRYGVTGFCVYYYNFGDQRALDQAFEAVVGDQSVDFPFFVCWANENWTRHWDGGLKHIIFEQKYDQPTLDDILGDVVRYASDPRYLKVNGKPLFAVYRPMLLPDPRAFAALCRARFRAAGFEDCHLVFVESMETATQAVLSATLGFDACIEFPPHGNAIETSEQPTFVQQDFAGAIYDYEATVAKITNQSSGTDRRYPTVFPGWDNSPRQPKGGDSFMRATPEAFQVYVEEKLDEMRRMFVGDERLLFVNAWNEWAEGAHLEPDQMFGHRWLEALRNALAAKSLL